MDDGSGWKHSLGRWVQIQSCHPGTWGSPKLQLFPKCLEGFYHPLPAGRQTQIAAIWGSRNKGLQNYSKNWGTVTMAKAKASVGRSGDNQRVLQTTAVSFQGVLEWLDDRTIELGVEEGRKKPHHTLSAEISWGTQSPCQPQTALPSSREFHYNYCFKRPPFLGTSAGMQLSEAPTGIILTLRDWFLITGAATRQKIRVRT